MAKKSRLLEPPRAPRSDSTKVVPRLKTWTVECVRCKGERWTQAAEKPDKYLCQLCESIVLKRLRS